MTNFPHNDEQDHLSSEFLMQLQRIMPLESVRIEFADRLTVTIPAKSSAVGDITVWVESDEITVGIGEIHHSHFEVYTQAADTLDERERFTAELAADYIGDIIEDRIRFRLEFERGRCLSSMSWYPEHTAAGPPLSRADEIREYVWSGRLT